MLRRTMPPRHSTLPKKVSVVLIAAPSMVMVPCTTSIFEASRAMPSSVTWGPVTVRSFTSLPEGLNAAASASDLIV